MQQLYGCNGRNGSVQQLRQATAEQIVEEKKEEVTGMKKWMAAIGLVVLLLVGVMPANIRQAEAKISSILANLVFDTVSIENETIEKGKSISFSVSNPRADLDFEIRGYKWTVKNGLTDFSSDEELFTGINTNTLTINDVDKNCILNGATVSLTLIVDVNGEPSELPITNTAKLSASHTPGEDWIIDEEASSGAIQVSNKTCTACGTVVDTKTEVAPLENPVYVGEQALQNAGDRVTGNSGTATLYIAQDGSPVLVLDNYVYTGVGSENTEDNYAGIYYGGSDTLYIFCGPNEDSRAVSQNTITVTAEGAKYSRGIYVPNGTLHIGTTGNETEDTLTVTAGTATIYSDGIRANQFKVQGATIDFYTSTDVNSTGRYELTSNCVINATGGTAEGYAWPKSYGINCTGDATFSGGKITAIGGKASYEGVDKATPEAKTYGINAAAISISEADVIAIGGTCGKATSGTNGNYAYSYGCYGNITMTSGSLTATGADLLEEAGHRVKESCGIYGSINVSGGTVIATGGNTINGLCYGIYATGDCIFSDTADVTIKTNDATTDDDLYGLYLKDPATVTVADSAEVDITVATEGEYETYGIYAYTGNNKYVQTGGTVTVSAVAKGTKAYGIWIQEAEISGGTLEVSNKQTAIIISNLTLNGGQVTGKSTGVEADSVYYSPYGVRITTLTMTGGSITGTGGASTYAHSEGVSISTATVSGGIITGTGGRGYSETYSVMSYGVNITGTLTLSGGTVTGTAGQASSTSEGVYIQNAILSNNAQIEGQGGISDRDNSVGVSINDASVSDTVTITGNGGQATGSSVGVYFAKADFNDSAQIVGRGGTSNSKDSIGVSFGSSITMGAESKAQVTGNGGSGANSMGIKYAGSTLSLLGGSLTATGGTGTTASYGFYTTNNFLMDGTLLTAKGYTSAVGCNSSKEISSDVIVVSTDIAGTSPSPLQYGGHVISTLAEYKYLKAGTTGEVGAEPGKRDISGATITLASSSLTYDGTEQTMTVTSVKLGSVELLDEVTISGNKATDAGTYTLTVTAKDSSYYTGSAEKPFTVNPLKITPDVTVIGGPYVYRSTVDPSAVVVKHGDVVLKLNVDYTVDIHTSTVGENGGIAYVYSNSGNYTFNRVDAYFTVVKAENPVEVTTPLTVIRGGNWVGLDYSNNKSGAPSYSFVGDALGCIIENGALTSGDTEGTVTVQATFPASNFYNEAERTITVTITDKNRAELDWVTLKDADYQYNDATILAQVYHSGSGSRVKEDIIEYSGTTRSGAIYARSTTPPTQAGTYTVYVTYETKDTIYTGSDDFVVNPKYIASNITVTLGEALTYNGTEQTQMVTEVRDKTADYNFSAAEYTITGNKQTNAGYYSLDITGIGNFTGTKTVSYEIAKATPTLGDFEIPSYDREVDYTGEYIEITPPTSTKNGMGNTYIETYVRNAGTYNITFRVSEGTNYTAASGFTYGTITVNKVYRNISTTNAVVGINGKTIDLDERVAGEENIGATFTIVAGDDLGCTINGSTFFSGSKAGNVTVQVTVSGDNNYLETIRTFTVEVVEVGGVKVWGGVTSSGSSSDENTIQLLQGGEVKYEMTILGNSIAYSFDGVAAGTYTLRVSKANHITVEKEVTVASEDVHVETVELKLGSGGKEFKINGANLNLNQDINVIYRVTVPDGFTNPYMVFEFCDKETTVSYFSIDANGRLCFSFLGVSPHYMGDNICATLYATVAGTEVSVCVPNYSVRQYCVNQLKKGPSEDLLRLISDLLVYGEKTQIYQNYKTEELVTTGLSLSPSEYLNLDESYNVQKIVGEANPDVRYSAVSLSLSNDMALRLRITSTNPSDYMFEVTINGRTTVYTSRDLESIGNNMYYLYYRGIQATEFDMPVTAVIKKDGVQTSQTLYYSVDTYIQKNQNATDVALRELLKAIHNYGEAAKLLAQ